MNIRWDNIIPLVVIIVLLVLLAKLPPLLRGIAEDMSSLGGHHGDPTIGLLALGLICVTVVCVFRIISNGRR